MGRRIRIPIEGKLEIQFWIRALALEGEIETIVEALHEKTERKTAFSPIVYEYEAGSMLYCALLGVRLDPLGLTDGKGIIWISVGQENHQIALKERDEFADEMIKHLSESGGWDEVREIPTGREA